MSSPARSLPSPSRRIGRYALYDEVGHGGTATVHLGRLLGPAGFSKTVAIKRMREHVGRDSAVAAMFLDEARLSGRIRHPNVVATIDLLSLDGDLFLVLEYVHGETLAALQAPSLAGGEPLPPAIAVHVLGDALAGLHAAHEALDESGRPLGLVHRDVSPQNIQVGVDGIARVLDFGIAQALGRLQDTHTGQVKGKIAYMAPEQLLGQPLDRRTDVFAAGVVLWELLAGRRLFQGENPGETVQRVLSGVVPELEELRPDLPPALCAVVRRAMQPDPGARYSSALEFAQALEGTTTTLSPRAVGAWVTERAGEGLAWRSQRLREIESSEAPREESQVRAVAHEAHETRRPVTEPRAASLLFDEETASALLGEAAAAPEETTSSSEPARFASTLTGVPVAPVSSSGSRSSERAAGWRRRRPWLVPGAAALGGALLWFVATPSTSENAPSASESSPVASESAPSAPESPSAASETRGELPADSASTADARREESAALPSGPPGAPAESETTPPRNAAPPLDAKAHEATMAQPASTAGTTAQAAPTTTATASTASAASPTAPATASSASTAPAATAPRSPAPKKSSAAPSSAPLRAEDLFSRN